MRNPKLKELRWNAVTANLNLRVLFVGCATAMGSIAMAQSPTYPSKTVYATPVQISEFIAHSDLPVVDAIEIQNTSDRAVNLKGWQLVDKKKLTKEDGTPQKDIHVIDDLTLEPGQYYTFRLVTEDWDSMGVDRVPGRYDVVRSFGLKAAGDTISLFDADGKKIDSITFKTVTHHSFTRHTNSIGEKDEVPLAQFSLDAYSKEDLEKVVPDLADLKKYMTNPRSTRTDYNTFLGNLDIDVETVAFIPDVTSNITSGQNRSPIAVGPLAITEMMPWPADGGLEFIEVMNISNESITLASPKVNKFKGSWGVEELGFEFPMTSKIDAGQRILLVRADAPADPVALKKFVKNLRSTYGITKDVQVFFYSKSLSEIGRVTLQGPEKFKPSIPDFNDWDNLPVAKYDVDKVKFDRTAYSRYQAKPDDVIYDTIDPQWASVLKKGYSMQRKSTKQYANEPQSWALGTKGGTPGR